MREGDVVLGVGCGAGQTLLQLAERVGPAGQVIGVDIARLLLEVARERVRHLKNVELVEADATAVNLGDQSLDAVFSRFGVMAFSDPVAAFSNLHRMLKPDGRLAFVCWRSLAENELDLLPLRAAGLEHLADATPFSFEEPAHVQEVLHAAGFLEVRVVADDQDVTSGGLDALLTVFLAVGPLGKIIRENSSLRAVAEPRVRAALDRRGDPAHVALRAATWIVTAIA